MEKPYRNIEITRKENSEIEIKGEIPAEAIAPFRAKALKELGEKAELPGFRKGHVPEKILVERLGELKVLEEAAERALQEAYPEIVREEKLPVIGRPYVRVTKLVPGEAIAFVIDAALFPEITLPDYKKIAREVTASHADETAEVTDEEFDAFVKDIQKSRAKATRKELDPEGKAGDIEDKDLPELTDTFVKSLGKFENVEDFKTKIRDNMQKDKELRLKEKHRLDLSEKIIAGSTIPLPRIIIESELDKMMAQFEGDIERMGMKLEGYLSHIKKSEDDLRNEWRDDAAKRAKLQLVLNKIAETEKIEADKDIVEHETVSLGDLYPDADKENIRTYITTRLQNEATFTFLETQK